jgi:hypothetical protein
MTITLESFLMWNFSAPDMTVCENCQDVIYCQNCQLKIESHLNGKLVNLSDTGIVLCRSCYDAINDNDGRF